MEMTETHEMLGCPFFSSPNAEKYVQAKGQLSIRQKGRKHNADHIMNRMQQFYVMGGIRQWVTFGPV